MCRCIFDGRVLELPPCVPTQMQIVTLRNVGCNQIRNEFSLNSDVRVHYSLKYNTNADIIITIRRTISRRGWAEIDGFQDDVIKWKHFPRYWPFVRGGQRWIPRAKASDTELWCFSLICACINGWVNNGEAGDWRRLNVHNDINVMT